ncbi:squalene/phytoene synthase family protein [Thalassobaculum sp. OXR-137]|uniref:phytoene/squalene synthase family protein n=1 Tax=Thalassobaculum sp. OXR-137 TaxID=3100173 RepID=UPI002AC90FAA|nr:squalene/phytoene synthase family protein [Thalassobaculum sp. OXR-137]WPZ32996.1 squalene/phytoene synthase family protein [Thalassobaculum sp. OXR-137]
MTDATLASHLAACAEIVRRHDRERYLVSLFAAPEQRDGLFAVLAANHEIAKIAEVVSDPTIGLIRLQWWREAFDGIEAGTPRAHEVVLPLSQVAERHPELLSDLRRVVDAREGDLSEEPAADLDALEDYAAATGGEVTAAMARVLGADTEMARNVGTAWALIGLVRAMPVLLAAGRAPLPASVLEAAGTTLSRIKDLPASVDLGALCRPILARGQARLSDAETSPALRSRPARPLRLLAARAQDLLGALARTGGDPRDPALADIPASLAWRHALRAARFRLF